MLTVVVLAAPLPPNKAGGVAKRIVDTPAPGVEPRPAPLNRTVAPAFLVQLVNVNIVDPPAPGNIVIVLSPVLEKVIALASSEEAELGLP